MQPPWPEWRLPPIDTWPKAVAFAQTVAGKATLFAVFAVLMKLNARGLWTEAGGLWLLLTVAAAAISLAGRHRPLVLLACAAALLVRVPDWIEFRAVLAAIEQEHLTGTVRAAYLRVGALLAFFALAAAAIHAARRHRDHRLARRPVLAQHIVFACLLGLAASHLLHGVSKILLWSITAVFAAYFWFLAYALIDQRHRQPAPGVNQFATFNPFAWPMSVPIGKGAAYWRSVEAATAEQLAVTQLKALKLLVWALLLKGLLWLYRWVIYGKLGVPPLAQAFDEFLLGGAVPVPFGLFSILANFPEQLLGLAVWGHMMVAAARLAGFRLLRNTWRPLASRTIAEFWNRYFYYFKELLANVYFYPTYVRWFKRHPRLRIAFATFMAAGAGNFFFHFILANHAVAEFGLTGALVRSQTYAFYCVVLAGGIILSQLRARRPDALAGWLRAQFMPSLGVVLFYCFLSFFDGPQRHVSLAQHLDFLLQVFRLDRWNQAIA